MAETVLALEGLVTEIGGHRVVDSVSLDVRAGEVVALVGESGSGKSLTALSVMGLLPPAARVTGGHAWLRRADTPPAALRGVRPGTAHRDAHRAAHRTAPAAAGEDSSSREDLLCATPARMRAIRGADLSMIFQEPQASLDPLMRVGAQVAESLIVHGRAGPAAAAARAVEMLARVGIPDAPARARAYPGELSGGMCQRVMIACALIAAPRLLIADEPTTALDVTIQAQILALMKRLRNETGTAILIITHDMGVVADIADRVCVMYGGRIVEHGPAEAVLARPAHPYTRALLASLPRLDGQRKTELPAIEGHVPDLADWPAGCRFRDRCALADAACATAPDPAPVPREGAASSGHWLRCWHPARTEAG